MYVLNDNLSACEKLSSATLLVVQHFVHFFKVSIDRLHVNFYILIIFISLYFCMFFLCGANQLYVRLALSHEFKQFGSLHISVHQGKISAAAGFEPGVVF